MSNLDKKLQGKTIYGIYIKFFKTRSGDPVGRPGRETLLEHPREYRIFVAVAPRIENRFGFKLMVTLISNSMINSSIQSMNTKVLEEKKELLKILISY